MKTSSSVTKPVVAIDIGGTKIIAALFSGDGTMLDNEVIPTLAEQGLPRIFDRVADTVTGLLEKNRFTPGQAGAIVIAAAGGVDTGRGVVVTPSPHLPGWENAPLAAMFQNKLNITSYVLNDASAAALGEHRFGAGQGHKDIVLITIGTGIGGGIIIDDKLYLGAVGAAGELGHITVEAHGPKCGCGNTGCLETLVSGSAIERDALERLKHGEKSTLVYILHKGEKSVKAEDIASAACKGDKMARDVMAQAAFYLGVGFTCLLNLFNPELIIYGGGMAGLEDLLIRPAEKLAMARSFSISARSARIVKAALGNEAGIYGAAAYGLDIVRREK
jgi:glucokinase